MKRDSLISLVKLTSDYVNECCNCFLFIPKGSGNNRTAVNGSRFLLLHCYIRDTFYVAFSKEKIEWRILIVASYISWFTASVLFYYAEIPKTKGIICQSVILK